MELASLHFSGWSPVFTSLRAAFFVPIALIYPMIQKSFITSPDLSGMQAAKGHYLLMHGNLRGFDAFIEDVIEFSGLGDFIHLPT
jgi:lipopolysaccharide transport system ATP-binding protein